MTSPASVAHPALFPALVAFDLDDTLAPSKSPLPQEMARVISDLLSLRPVCVISGGRFLQFEQQILQRLPADAALHNLHLMPTCGTRYERFYDGEWHEEYAHDLSEVDRQRTIESLERHSRELGLWEPDGKVKGSRIEDRGSQITYSALGQAAAVDDKKAWDLDGSKREKLRAAVAGDLPDLEVRAGGSTSIDVTSQGIDKAYGMRALAELTGIDLGDMLFIGDRLEPGGNDYPVRELAVPCKAVKGPDDTLAYLAQLIPALRDGDSELIKSLTPAI